MAWRRFSSKAREWFKKEGAGLGQTAVDLAKFWGLFHVSTTYGVNMTLCIGPSMMPTFRETGDLVLIDNFSYKVRYKDYKAGDVIISICPYDAEKTVCKRVAGVAGDVVVVNRNNGAYREPILIPPGHVWLAGDNSWNSTDSRTYGPVPIGLLRGRVFWKLKPTFNLGEPISTVAPPPPPPPARKNGAAVSSSGSVNGQEKKSAPQDKDAIVKTDEQAKNNLNSSNDESKGTATPITNDIDRKATEATSRGISGIEQSITEQSVGEKRSLVSEEPPSKTTAETRAGDISNDRS